LAYFGKVQSYKAYPIGIGAKYAKLNHVGGSLKLGVLASGSFQA